MTKEELIRIAIKHKAHVYDDVYLETNIRIHGLNKLRAICEEYQAVKVAELEAKLADHQNVINMLILTGEDECVNIERYPAKLRAIIDAMIIYRRSHNVLKNVNAAVKNGVAHMIKGSLMEQAIDEALAIQPSQDDVKD